MLSTICVNSVAGVLSITYWISVKRYGKLVQAENMALCDGWDAFGMKHSMYNIPNIIPRPSPSQVLLYFKVVNVQIQTEW